MQALSTTVPMDRGFIVYGTTTCDVHGKIEMESHCVEDELDWESFFPSHDSYINASLLGFLHPWKLCNRAIIACVAKLMARRTSTDLAYLGFSFRA